MQNVQMKTEKTILTLNVDLNKIQGQSKTGKTIIIATTNGNQPIPGFDGYRIGLNIYKIR